MAVERFVDQTVVGDLADLGAEHFLQERGRLGTLNLQRRDIEFMDFNIKSAGGVDALRPQQHVGVGDAEPELVVGNPQQHGVVDNAAVLVAEDHITALHRGQQAMHITGDEIVDELGSVGALDLDLAFDGHIHMLTCSVRYLYSASMPPSSGLM